MSTLVSSHLNYGISVWGDSKTSYIKKIETIQRKQQEESSMESTMHTQIQSSEN